MSFLRVGDTVPPVDDVIVAGASESNHSIRILRFCHKGIDVLDPVETIEGLAAEFLERIFVY